MPSTSAPVSARTRLVERPAQARATLGDAPFRLANALQQHPLFEDDRIKRLLRAMPREKVEIRRVEFDGAQDGGYRRGPRLDVDPVAAFDGLATQPTWMLLHDSWKHDEDVASLLREYVADLAESFDAVSIEFLERDHFVFPLRPREPLTITFGFYSPSISFCYPGGEGPLGSPAGS